MTIKTSTLKPAPSPKERPVLGMIPEMTKDMLSMFMDLTFTHLGQAIGLKPEATLRPKGGMKMVLSN